MNRTGKRYASSRVYCFGVFFFGCLPIGSDCLPKRNPNLVHNCSNMVKTNPGENVSFSPGSFYAILIDSGPKHAFSGSSKSFVWENLKPHPGHHPDAIILLSSWVLKTTFQATVNHPGVILLRFVAVASSWSHPVKLITRQVFYFFGKVWILQVEGSIILVE